MAARPGPPIRPHLRDLRPYAPVKPLDVLARELGLPEERLVKLDANENLYGPLPEIRDALARADHHIYPDPTNTRLREAIGEYVGASPEMVVVGAGADEIIDVLIRVVDTPSVVNTPPTFGMYEFLAQLSNVPVIDAERCGPPDYAVDVEAVQRAVGGGARLVFITSPNNPTGALVPSEQLEQLLQLDAVIVIDEAYAEFAGTSVVPLVAEHPNLVAIRTFSKWAGIAGLRIGYAVAHTGLAHYLDAVRQPYNISTAAGAAALVALENRALLLERVQMIVAERERLIRELEAIPWLEPVPSRANYVLVHVSGRTARSVYDALRARGVLVRYYDHPRLANDIRISIGRPEDTDRLLEELHALEAAT